MIFNKAVFALLIHLSISFAMKRELPSGPLIMGYSSICDPDRIIRAVKTGVNVVFWFSIDLVEYNGKPSVVESAVQPMPNVSCIVDIAAKLRKLDLKTTHMVSVGGWGAPDPVTTFSASEMWQAWKDWNKEIDAAGLPGGFDGIDWDMEGANDPEAPSNMLTIDVLDLVGEMSQLAQIDGYIVSMVPPESYLDTTTSAFDLSLLHPYPEWEGIVDFYYHGHNCYAYLLAKYGSTTRSNTIVDTFDIVTIQLYESYTHMEYNISAAPADNRQTASDYLIEYVPKVLNGWEVDFASLPEAKLITQIVSVKQTVLCIGIANGWITKGKNALVMPEQAQIAYETLKVGNSEPRGFAFWAIDNEGEVPAGQDDPLYLSAGLNEFLHTRK